MSYFSKYDTSVIYDYLNHPIPKGSLLGVTVMATVTPLLKWTNHAYKDERMPRSNYFRGATSYASSAIPAYATSFAIRSWFCRDNQEQSAVYQLLTTFIAGGVSGFVCTPFEAIAQNKQLATRSSTYQTAVLMRTHHGYTSLFRGGASMVLREGLWSMVYMAAIPIMSQRLQEQGLKKEYAQTCSVVAIAGVYGLISSPISQLRYRKQEGLTVPSQNKTYFQHTKDIWNQASSTGQAGRYRSFFKAAFPRSVTTTVSAALLGLSDMVYEHAIKKLSP